METRPQEERHAPGWKSRLTAALSERDLDEVMSTIEGARRLLSPESMPALEDIQDFEAATMALNTAWCAVSRALNGDETAVEAVTTSPDLVQLMLRIREAENTVRRLETSQRDKAGGSVLDALTQLGGLSQLSQLTNACPRVMSELGFDRTMLSMVDQATWIPTAAYVEGDPAWAAIIIESGQETPQRLIPTLPEFDLVRRSQGILVSEAQKNPTVNKAIVEPSLSRSYVAAGIKRGGNLVGLLHCDLHFHKGEVSTFDRDLLNMFAMGFGYLLERAMLLDRATAIQNEVSRLTGRIGTTLGAMTNGKPMAMEASAPSSSRAPDSMRGWSETATERYGLTRREMEVLKLMVAGESNGKISDQLVISAGTVKSHVKHILRKLGASNRAEAIAKWYIAQQQS